MTAGASLVQFLTTFVCSQVSLQQEVRGERSRAPGQALQLGPRPLLERAARPVVEASIGVKSRLFGAVFLT